MAIDNPNDSLKAELAAKTAAPASAETTSAVSANGIQTNPMSSPVAASSASASLANANPSSPYDYQGRVDTINKMYDSAINQTRSNLDSTYEQNRSDLEANREQLARTYQNQRNANAADYERARRNFNQQALANGLNTGAGSQAALAQNAVYNKNQGALGASEAAANTELDRSLANLKIQYQNSINSAIAENDYNRAATLLDEYNNQYSMALNNAQLLSQYGDFSGYASLFGQDTADQMRQMWMYQNPGIAYSMGELSADDYYKLTGSYPPGYSSGGGGYYYYYPSDDGDDTVSAADGASADEPPLPEPGPTTFAGQRGGPSFDAEADPMAGRVANKPTSPNAKSNTQSTTQSQSRPVNERDPMAYKIGENKLAQTYRQPISEPVATVTKPQSQTGWLSGNSNRVPLSEITAIRGGPGISQPTMYRDVMHNPNSPNAAYYQAREDLKTLRDTIQDTLTPDYYREPDPALSGNLYANGYWNNPNYIGANGEYIWPVSGVNNLSGLNAGSAPVLQSDGSVGRVTPTKASGTAKAYQSNYQAMQQRYVDALNAQSQAKADQYPSSSLYYYVPAQYQLVNGQIVRTGGKLLPKVSNPPQGYNSVQSASSLFPGYARQDSNNWIMGPNFRIPMTTNVSR